MIRSVLLALDGSSASQTATHLALKFVSRRSEDVQVTGIAVLDRPTITKPQPTPMGTGGLKQIRDATLLENAERRTTEILAEFQETCQAAGIKHEVSRPEGLPFEEIANASHVHDLIFIGKETNFQFETSDDRCETVKRLLQNHPCPIVVTPAEVVEGKSVVVAYDGSRASSRALHTFALLELTLDDLQVHVVSIDKDLSRAQGYCASASELLARHGFQSQSHPLESRGDAAQTILDKASELDAQAVVMGAFGRSGLKAAFFGSATRKLLNQSPFPLFLY